MVSRWLGMREMQARRAEAAVKETSLRHPMVWRHILPGKFHRHGEAKARARDGT